jgi:hypothetical protein
MSMLYINDEQIIEPKEVVQDLNLSKFFYNYQFAFISLISL